MSDPNTAVRTQLTRQVAHWTAAAMRLQDLDDLASPSAWNSLERYLGLSIRQHLTMVVEKLKREAILLQTSLDSAFSIADLSTVRRQLLTFRRRYLRVEATLDFYADAISTRTSLRLWDETSLNPVAAIKITRHNLHRPTALIHEAGHQVAHIVGWSEELSKALTAGLTDTPAGVAEAWGSWASEIAADAFSFVHTGYASVASLYDVVDGGESVVFRHPPGDPHPVGYLRVLLGVEMCRQFYGAGPWDDLALAWTQQYPLQRASGTSGQLLRESVPLLPSIVNITLRKPMRSFGGRPLVALINPERVKPETLLALEQQLGAALYTSMHWIWTEALRLLALTGLRKATSVDRTTETIKLQEQWMLRLGGALQAA